MRSILDKLMNFAQILLFFLTALLFFSPLALTDNRPNILFILIDDQAIESLDVYGDQYCHTLNIDRIAQQGMHLTDAHHMGS